MARILLSAFSNVTWTKEKYHDSFVEGFSNALKRCGNEILRIRVNDFMVTYSLTDLRPDIDTHKILKKIKDFDPDLIIVFNNTFIDDRIVDETNCPIICFASDSPSFFTSQNLFKKYLDRYYFLNSSNDTIKSIPKWFDFISKDRLFLFGHATDLRTKDIKQDINLSFVGSIPNYSYKLTQYFMGLESMGDNLESKVNPNKIKDDFFEALDKFRENTLSDFDYCFPSADEELCKNLPSQVILMLTCKARLEVLSNLTDLGLKTFGFPYSWGQIIQYNYELFRCYDYSLSVSLEHSEKNYNRSKISLNLPHGHAHEGFSWRVCDILASNAVLLSNKQPDLVNMTKGYLDLPMYESPAEARELAIKLLKDDIWRKELSRASQKMIEEKCRFENKFKMVESVIPGISLFSTDEGKITDLNTNGYLKPEQKKIKNKIKIFFRGKK